MWRSPAEFLYIFLSAAQPCFVGGREREWKALPKTWKQFLVRLLLCSWVPQDQKGVLSIFERIVMKRVKASQILGEAARA